VSEVAGVVLVEIVVPGVVGSFLVVVGHGVVVLIEKVKASGSSFGNEYGVRPWCGQVELAVAHGDAGARPVYRGSKAGSVVQVDRAVAYVNHEVVALSEVDIEVGGTFADFQFRVFAAGIAQGEPGELDAGIGCQMDGAAILEFDLYASVILRGDARALQDRQILQRHLEAVAGPAVNLNISLNVAQADDPRLGICKQGGG
jgi:hypothetical protein